MLKHSPLCYRKARLMNSFIDSKDVLSAALLQLVACVSNDIIGPRRESAQRDFAIARGRLLQSHGAYRLHCTEHGCHNDPDRDLEVLN